MKVLHQEYGEIMSFCMHCPDCGLEISIYSQKCPYCASRTVQKEIVLNYDEQTFKK